MPVLLQLWNEKTTEFNTLQKAVIGATLAFIFTTSFYAMVLISMEIAAR